MRIVAATLGLLGIARLAGTTRDTWKSRDNALGILLISLAFIVHGIFVTGVASFSPRSYEVWIGGAYSGDAIAFRSGYVWVSASRDNPVPPAAYEFPYRVGVEFTHWDRQAQVIEILPFNDSTHPINDIWEQFVKVKDAKFGAAPVGQRWRRGQHSVVWEWSEILIALGGLSSSILSFVKIPAAPRKDSGRVFEGL